MPEELREAFQLQADTALRVLLSILRDKEARAADRIKAAEIILDRGYGKPRQSVEISEDVEGGVIFLPTVALIGEPEE